MVGRGSDPFSKKDQKALHLSFAYDLIVFCGADKKSCSALKRLLDDFCLFSGVSVNFSKSSIIFSGSTANKQEILNLLGMKEAPLPIKYLGLPLFSSRYRLADCAELLSKVRSWVSGWMVAPSHLLEDLNYSNLPSTISTFIGQMLSYFLSPVWMLLKKLCAAFFGILRDRGASTPFAGTRVAQIWFGNGLPISHLHCLNPAFSRC